MATPNSALPIAPPPWTCHCSAYILPFYASPSTSLPLHIAYAPLEAQSPQFSSPSSAGKALGGLAFAQIMRYTDTPVGPYDELVILPGSFAGPADLVKRNNGKGKRDLRITGIWVSSEATLVNGRRNWNIPKHMARFSFTPVPGQSGATKVEIFPHTMAGAATIEVPFFTAVIHSIPYVPALPFNSSWMGYLGQPTHILQPPLPEGEDPRLEVGTQDWKRADPSFKCVKARMVWIDTRQTGRRGGDGMTANSGEVEGEGGGKISREHREEEGWENWWPGMGRWHLGLECPETVLELGEPEILG